MGRFAPGKSGNPGGRPREVGRVKELARQHTEEAVGTLVAVMRNRKSPAASRIRAAELLLDRGWGKAETKAEIGPLNPYGAMTTEELEADLIGDLVAVGIPKQMAETFVRRGRSSPDRRADGRCRRNIGVAGFARICRNFSSSPYRW